MTGQDSITSYHIKRQANNILKQQHGSPELLSSYHNHLKNGLDSKRIIRSYDKTTKGLYF